MGVYSGNRTLLAESSYNESNHVMDYVIECEKNDLHMFEAVINCDFVQAYSEAGITSVSSDELRAVHEAAEKGIFQKIKDAFRKAIDTVKRYIATFIAKIKNMLSNDGKLVKEYKENFMKNAVGYEISGWTPIKLDVDKTLIKEMKNATSGFKGLIDMIKKIDSTDAIDKEMESFKDLMKDNYNDLGRMIDDKAFNKTDKSSKDYEKHRISTEDRDTIMAIMDNSGSMIKRVQNIGKICIGELEKMRDEIKFDYNSTDDKEDLELARLNAAYKASNIAIKKTNKLVNACVSAVTRYIAIARKAFVKIGKNAEEKKVEESYIDYMLDEASDIYVEKTLSMVS